MLKLRYLPLSVLSNHNSSYTVRYCLDVCICFTVSLSVSGSSFVDFVGDFIWKLHTDVYWLRNWMDVYNCDKHIITVQEWLRYTLNNTFPLRLQFWQGQGGKLTFLIVRFKVVDDVLCNYFSQREPCSKHDKMGWKIFCTETIFRARTRSRMSVNNFFIISN